MKQSDELDSQRYVALKKELENSVFEKLKLIEEKILTKTSGSHSKDVQVLIMVNDELDDVLLNWEDSIILPTSLSSDSFDDDEDDEF
jgi:hypothetical protein